MKPWVWKYHSDPPTRPFGTAVVYTLHDGRGRNRATVWDNGVWSTWDEHGTGGENCEATSVRDALDHVMAAVVRQGWVPFKVEYPKRNFTPVKVKGEPLSEMIKRERR